MVGATTGAAAAGAVWVGGGEEGEEDGDMFGWSAMKRRAAVACLSRGEKRELSRAREASMLERVCLEDCRGGRVGEGVDESWR